MEFGHRLVAGRVSLASSRTLQVLIGGLIAVVFLLSASGCATRTTQPEVVENLSPAEESSPPVDDGALDQADEFTSQELFAAVSPSIVRVEQSVDGDQVGVGTGFVVESDLIVTAAHVVDGGDAVTIEMNDGYVSRASVLAVDCDLDVLGGDVGDRSLSA